MTESKSAKRDPIRFLPEMIQEEARLSKRLVYLRRAIDEALEAELEAIYRKFSRKE